MSPAIQRHCHFLPRLLAYFTKARLWSETGDFLSLRTAFAARSSARTKVCCSEILYADYTSVAWSFRFKSTGFGDFSSRPFCSLLIRRTGLGRAESRRPATCVMATKPNRRQSCSSGHDQWRNQYFRLEPNKRGRQHALIICTLAPRIRGGLLIVGSNSKSPVGLWT